MKHLWAMILKTRRNDFRVRRWASATWGLIYGLGSGLVVGYMVAVLVS